MWDLAGSKGPKVKDGKSLPLNLYVGHFLKPYFKDKVTGVVSRAAVGLLGEGWCPGSLLCYESSLGVRNNVLQPPEALLGSVVKVKASSPGMGLAGLCSTEKPQGMSFRGGHGCQLGRVIGSLAVWGPRLLVAAALGLGV